MPHRARRLWLVAAIVVLVIVAGAAAAVRWALDPLLLKTLAESRLSAALGQPVRIGSVHLSFLPSLSVAGTDIVVGTAAGPGGSSLGIRGVRLRPRLSTIFSRPVVIDRVDIDGLALEVVRDANGGWLLPLPAGAPSPAGADSERASLDVASVVLQDGRLTIIDARPGRDAVPARTTPIDHIEATVQRTADRTRLEGLTASVGRSKVVGSGSLGADGLRLNLRWSDLRPSDLAMVFALVGTNAPPGLILEGRNPLTLELQVDPRGRVSAAGQIAVDRAGLGTLAVTSFAAPIRLDNTRLTVYPMGFRAYSGGGSGRVTVNAGSSPVAWAVNGTLQRVDIDRFLSENTTAKGKVSGTGNLDVRLAGTSRVPVARTAGGEVRAAISNGTIRDFPLVSAVYSALKLGPGGDRDLHFQTLSASFVVADERARTTDLVAQTGEMTITAAGTIGFDQGLALAGTAAFSPGRSDAFVHSIRELSALKNSAGQIEVPFTVAGTVGAPRFSIDVAGLARRGLENEIKRRLGDRLRDLFKKKN